MHQGQLATLEDVLHFYSTLEGAGAARPPPGDDPRPLELTDAERADLEAFLESLTDEPPGGPGAARTAMSARRSPCRGRGGPGTVLV